MRKLLSISLLAIMAMACSKNENSINDKPIACVISSYSRNGTEIAKYTYGSDNRLTTSYSRVSSVNFLTEKYTYNSNNLTTEIYDQDESNMKFAYNISNGIVTTAQYFNQDLTVYFTIENNNLKQVSLTPPNRATVTYNYTWTDGNLTTAEKKITDNTDTMVIEYSNELRPEGFNYDYVDYNFFNWHDIDRKILTNAIFGKMPKNLVSKISYNDGSSKTYTYIKDTNGKITQMTTSNGVTTNFNYTCN